MNSKQDKEKENLVSETAEHQALELILKADGDMTVTPTPDCSTTEWAHP